MTSLHLAIYVGTFLPEQPHPGWNKFNIYLSFPFPWVRWVIEFLMLFAIRTLVGLPIYTRVCYSHAHPSCKRKISSAYSYSTLSVAIRTLNVWIDTRSALMFLDFKRQNEIRHQKTQRRLLSIHKWFAKNMRSVFHYGRLLIATGVIFLDPKIDLCVYSWSLLFVY